MKNAFYFTLKAPSLMQIKKNFGKEESNLKKRVPFVIYW